MKQIIILITMAMFTSIGCNSNSAKVAENKTSMDSANCKDDCCKPKSKTATAGTKLSCKLTSPELQQRRATVIASLKKQMIDSKEITDGFVFIFPGGDKMLNEVKEFVKTEEQCCDFLNFDLTENSADNEIWLEMTGEEGTKEFIKTELGI